MKVSSFLFLLVLASAQVSGAAPPDCAELGTAAAYAAQFEKKLETLQARIKASEAGQQHRNQYVADVLSAERVWSTEERSRFFTEMLTDQKFVELQEAKQKPLGVYLETMARAFTIREQQPVEACKLSYESLTQLVEVLKANNAQYEHMRAKMTDIAKAKNVRIPPTTDDLTCTRELIRLAKEGVLLPNLGLACPPTTTARALTSEEYEAYKVVAREHMDTVMAEAAKRRKK